RTSGLHGTRSWSGIIEVIRAVQVDTVIADVANLEHIVRRKLLLDTEAVVLVITNVQVEPGGNKRGIGLRRTELRTQEEIGQGAIGHYVLCLKNRLIQAEGQRVQVDTSARSLWLIKHAEATADDSPICRRVREAESGCPLMLVCICQVLRQASSCCGLNVLPEKLICGGRGKLRAQVRHGTGTADNNGFAERWNEGSYLPFVSIEPR